MNLSMLLLAAVALGIVCGGIFSNFLTIFPFDHFITLVLCLVLFSIGIDIGRKKQAFLKIKTMGRNVLLLPLFIALGSILGTALVGLVLRLPVRESTAIGGGFGWYSLSAVIIAKLYNVQTGALALLTNVFRELIAIISIPFLAKSLDGYSAISPGGATTMDTTLPIISRFLSSDMVIIAFISGLILTAVVPVLVPLLLRIPF